MNKFLALFVVFCLISGFSFKLKKFPEINYLTSNGKIFTNENFTGKNTIVVLFHLGCPAAMYLLKDIETLPAQSENQIQIVGILENTASQINQFNSADTSEWKELRDYFKLKPVQIDLIGECETENITVDDSGNTVIGNQCRILSKKIGTKYSPTLVYVNEAWEITKIKKGYLSLSTPYERRISYLMDKN